MGNSVGDRLREAAVQRFGSVASLEKAIGRSPAYLSQYLAGRSLPGVKLRDALRSAGVDVDWVMTGRRGDDPTGGPSRIYYDMPEHLTAADGVKFKRVLETMGKVSKYDPEVADKVLIIIETTLVKKEAPMWPDVTKLDYEVKRYKKPSTEKVKHDK